MRVIAIVNQKGGVGKTTTCVNLAACLADRKKHVLLIDLDAQGNSGSGLGIDKKSVEKSIYDVLIRQQPLDEVMVKEQRKHLDVVPSTIDLAGAEVELSTTAERELCLRKAINELKEKAEEDENYKYDFVLIDCPPSLSLLTINALAAADSLLIPIQAEYYALEGVSQLLRTVELVRAALNPKLHIFGVLLTMYDSRTQLSNQVYEEVQNFFQEKLFHTVIPRNVRLSEAPSYGKSIVEYAWLSKGAAAYSNLAKEVLKRAGMKR